MVQDSTERKEFPFEEQLLNIAKGVSAATGEMFFRSLVEHLAKALGVDCAFIGQLINGHVKRIRTIAVCVDKRFVDNFEFELAGTPCGNLLRDNFCMYPEEVQNLFPSDIILKELGIEAYAGICLLSSGGQALGTMAVMHRRPLTNPVQIESMLKIFAARASAELERSNAEREFNEKSSQLSENLEAQSVVNALLQIGLENRTLYEILELSLVLILSISWLSSKASGAIFLLGDSPGTLSLEAQRGFNEHMQKECAVVPFGRCLCGRTALNQRIEYAASLDEHHEIRYEGIGPHGHYCVPILSAGTTLGVIALQLLEGHKWNQMEENFLYAVAGALSGIIQRKRMMDEREKLISELHELVFKISRSQKEWMETFDSITDAIFLSNLDFVIIRVNRATEKLLGIPIKQILGRKCHELFHGTTLPPKWCLGHRSIREGTVATVEMHEPCVNKFLDMRVIPRFDSSGQSVGLIHVIRNITEQKKLEEKLRHAQNMEAIGRLAAGVAHEVRNPLHSLMSVTEALHQELKENPAYAVYLSHINKQVGRLSLLMKDLLDLGKPVEPSNVRRELLPEICCAAVDLWKHSPSMQGHKVEVLQPPEHRNIMVMADSQRLQQVFLNLLDNAAQHSPEGSEIRVIIHEPAEKMVEVHIVDQGSGIPEELLSRVFEPFFSTRRGGSGLGLSIIRNIIESHGGSLVIRNNAPLPGCTAGVSLPLAEEESQ
ncbi:MAG TPA: hypothetical protein DCP92_23080 [Nitrospiraceae bacterium]|jgi:PAS domain S-box-containing protein|nr:hypothetical protein [Nitrospiraceae bacterium]